MKPIVCVFCRETLKTEDIAFSADDPETGDTFYYCKLCATDFFELLEEEIKRQKKIHLVKNFGRY